MSATNQSLGAKDKKEFYDADDFEIKRTGSPKNISQNQANSGPVRSEKGKKKSTSPEKSDEPPRKSLFARAGDLFNIFGKKDDATEKSKSPDKDGKGTKVANKPASPSNEKEKKNKSPPKKNPDKKT